MYIDTIIIYTQNYYCKRIFLGKTSLVMFLKQWKTHLKEHVSSATSEVAIACFLSIV